MAASLDAAYLKRQYEWGQQTFGPGTRLLGVLDHLRKELVEVEKAPDDLTEWVDLLLLAFDGAMRQGFEPQEIIDTVYWKLAKNKARRWPDWRTMSADRAIEHVRRSVEEDERKWQDWGHTLVHVAPEFPEDNYDDVKVWDESDT